MMPTNSLDPRFRPLPPKSTIYDGIYPQQYIAYRAPPREDASASSSSLAIDINGDLDKPFWNSVPWTQDFVDIATDVPPKFRTRVKMRWDDEFLYVAAMMEETDVWGTLTEHNSVIFHDNDVSSSRSKIMCVLIFSFTSYYVWNNDVGVKFEVFVDTDGTNHNYKEFEINALGTTWSLLLNKPYADNGGENSKRIDPNGYDMEPPLQSAVAVYPDKNAINRPDVTNTHWTTEVALPISKLMERNSHAKKPADGVFWRVNFSRVQWGVRINSETGKYEKSPCCQSCASPGSAAEDNWVWSRQGEVAMHLPERWGIVQFSSKDPLQEKMKYYEEWPARCAAMSLYYALKEYYKCEGKYTDDIKALKDYSRDPFPITDDADMEIVLIGNGFDASASHSSYRATVNQDRYLVVSMQGGLSDTIRQLN